MRKDSVDVSREPLILSVPAVATARYYIVPALGPQWRYLWLYRQPHHRAGSWAFCLRRPGLDRQAAGGRDTNR